MIFCFNNFRSNTKHNVRCNAKASLGWDFVGHCNIALDKLYILPISPMNEFTVFLILLLPQGNSLIDFAEVHFF